MLNFLKKRPLAELVSYDDGLVGFRCAAELPAGKSARLLCKVPDGPDFEATILVRGGQPPAYTGIVEKPENSGEFLSVLLPPSFVERRSEPRHLATVRVRSQDVEGYKAMTLNIAWRGLCLVLDGPKEPGVWLNLELEWDVPYLRPLKVEAEVLWCLDQPGGTRKFLVGARFPKLTQQQTARLREFFEHLAGRRGE